MWVLSPLRKAIFPAVPPRIYRVKRKNGGHWVCLRVEDCPQQSVGTGEGGERVEWCFPYFVSVKDLTYTLPPAKKKYPVGRGERGENKIGYELIITEMYPWNTIFSIFVYV